MGIHPSSPAQSPLRTTPCTHLNSRSPRAPGHPALGPFDNYVEMVMQFGYATLFSAAFPLAPMLAFVNNWVEVRLDGWNILQLCRRPEPR